MTLCDECGINPANVHLTQILQNEMHAFHLCEDCARKKGISISVNDEEFEGTEVKNTGVAPSVNERTCKCCKLKLSEFKARGWLGCPECYQEFNDEVEQMLLQVHGSTVHKGKKYHALTRSARGDLRQLRSELDVAIQNEQFEQAARIRDVIHGLKEMDLK